MTNSNFDQRWSRLAIVVGAVAVVQFGTFGLFQAFGPLWAFVGGLLGLVGLAFVFYTRFEKGASGGSDERIASALETCDQNVMIADADFNITYMNKTMLAMMKSAEADLRSELGGFNADELIGTNIDGFHKNPAHQRSMVGGLTTAYRTQITAGGRTFSLIANPIFDDNRVRTGTVVEWDDITDRLRAEAEEQQRSTVNARLRSALDSCRTNVMVADANYDLVYLNDTMLEMMRGNEAALREDLPNFDARKLEGSNIDIFHKTGSSETNS